MIKRKNYIGISIQIIGAILFFIGLIASMIISSMWMFLYSIVVLLLFLGFGEIIQLLQKIYVEIIRYTKGEDAIEPQQQVKSNVTENFRTIYPLSELEKDKVYDLFDSSQNKNHIRIIPTPYKHICIVDIEKKYLIVNVEKDSAKYVSYEEMMDSMPDLNKWAQDRKGIQLE